MKILWLKTELLHPVDKGGKIRTYNMLRELKRNHHVTYLTLDDGSSDRTAHEQSTEYCHNLVTVPFKQNQKFTTGFYVELALNMLSRLPYAVAKYRSSEMRLQIDRMSNREDYDLVICDFLAPGVNLPQTVNCPVVLFEHNVEAEIWRRHYEVQTDPIKKAYLLRQWRKMSAFEKEVCERADAVIAVSRDDREFIRNVYEVNNVYDVATGVDVDFFRPSGKVEQQPTGLIFTGSMDWLPNEDAIRYFVESILPLVRREVPNVTLTVVGRNPSPDLMKLSQRDPAIVVTGRVEDVRPYIEAAAAYIVPIRIGGGTRLKIYEAMAMGKPVVSTTVGAEGLPLEDGKEVLLADDPSTFAKAVIRVLGADEYAESIGSRAAELVRSRYGWSNVADQFATICDSVVLSDSKPAETARL